jgi:hypothetical protein
MKTQTECLFRSPSNHESNEIFEHVKIDSSRYNNFRVDLIVNEKRSQIFSIMDSLGMQKYSEKYNLNSGTKTLKKKMYSKHKISQGKKEKNEFPPIKLNTLDSSSKDSEINFKKKTSRNNTLYDTNDFTKSRKFLTKSESTAAHLQSTNCIPPLKSLYLNMNFQDQLEETQSDRLSNKRELSKGLTKVRTFSNINDYFAKSLFKQDLKLTDNTKINRNIRYNLVNTMFNNCLDNGKNIDSDFKQTMKSQTKSINQCMNAMTDFKEKEKELNKVIPLDINILSNHNKNKYVYIGGKKFDLHKEDGEDDYFAGLDKLTNMSPNLAYHFRYHFINKYKLNNKEGLPLDFKNKSMKQRIKKEGLHDRIDNLLKKSETDKGKMMQKLMNR